MKAENLQNCLDHKNSLLEQNAILTSSMMFFRSNKLEQLEFKMEKKYWNLETYRKS